MVTDWFNKNLGTPYESSPLPYLYHPYAGHDNNRDMYMFTQKESEFMARLAWHDWFPVVWLDAHQMGSNGRPHLRDAGHRSDQPQRAPADLPLERDPRAVAGGGARSGRQDGHHLQLDLHQLLAGRDGVERLVAQPDRPAHRDRQRAHRRADRSSCARRAGPLQPVGRRQRRRPAPVRPARRIMPPDRHAGAHRISAPVARRPLDAARHRRLRADLDAGAARNRRRSARDAAAADLRGEPVDGRRRRRPATCAAS